MANRFLSRTTVVVRCTLAPGGISEASAYTGIDLIEYISNAKSTALTRSSIGTRWR